MVPAIRTPFLGQNWRQRARAVGLAITLFVLTFGAYAAGVFGHSGGVIFVPVHAALVGVIAAVALGYWQNGLAFGWLAVYGPLLGSHADHAFLGIPHRTRLYQIGYFVRPDGLVFFAVEAAIIGTLGWTIGWGLRWSIDLLADETSAHSG